MSQNNFPTAGKVFTGPRAVLKMGQQVIGYASGVSVSENWDYAAIEVLDSFEVAEFVPLGYTCSATIDKIALIDAARTLANLGIIAEKGTDESEHLANIVQLVNAQGGFEMEIFDNLGGGTVNFATVQGCVIPSRGLSFSARGIVGENVTVLGKRVLDMNNL